MKWQEGRLNSGYFKKTLLKLWFFDLYLLKFPKGIKVPPHKDVVEGKRHFRINFLLKGIDTFQCPKTLYRKGRLVVFRPDLVIHSMSRLPETTYMLSFGFAIK